MTPRADAVAVAQARAEAALAAHDAGTHPFVLLSPCLACNCGIGQPLCHWCAKLEAATLIEQARDDAA